MKISLNIYMEAINGLHIENEPGQTSRSFSAVELLEDGTRSLCTEILYVCPLSLAVRLAAENADAAFIALRDRFRPDEIVPENIIIVSDDLTLTQLFMRLYRRQSLLCEWQSSMYDCIIRDMPIVGLLLSSEPVIGNFISPLTIRCPAGSSKTATTMSRAWKYSSAPSASSAGTAPATTLSTT